MAAKIEVVADNTDLVLDEMHEKILKALQIIGMQAMSHVVLNITGMHAVDTGLLRNSITYALGGEAPEKKSYKADKPNKSGKYKSGNYSGVAPKEDDYEVYVGTNVSYAPYVEMGTSKMAARPFLKNAIVEHKDEYRDIFETTMRE